MTPAEKKAKEELDAARKVEKDKKTMEREAQKKLEEERRQQRVAEKQAAQAERAAEIEAKKKAKEERRLEHEKREREKKEEAEKKARAQTKIASFFGKKEVVTPKPSTVVTAAVKARSPSPAAAVQTEYAKLALPFFVHPTVTMAKSPFVADEETSTAKTKILTDYLEGRQPPMAVKPFDPLPSLRLGGMPSPRGRSFPCVRDLMADQDGGASNPIELIAKSLNLPTKQSLKLIPMKQLSFHEDVRPGYYGTVTAVQSVTTLRKMARNPAAKELPLNYDYDSEAEWVQGEEEEDEAIDDMTDDDDDEDDAKSLNEFLDDDDDMGRATGRLMVGNLEPESSGICFEDRKRANPNPQMYKFRMEFLIREYLSMEENIAKRSLLTLEIADLDHHHSVDPFCTTYWPSNIKTAASTSPGQVKTKSGEKTVKSKASDQATNTAMPPPLAPVAKPAVAATASKVPDPVLDMVPAHQIEDFKAAVMQFKFLPKIALLPTLKKQFDRCTKDQIKATLEHVAEKHGRKDWELKQST